MLKTLALRFLFDNFFKDPENRKISIYLYVGEEGEAKAVAKNIEENKKNKELLKHYTIEINYPWLPGPWMQHTPWY